MKKNTLLLIFGFILANSFSLSSQGGFIPIQTTILDDDDNGEDWLNFINSNCELKLSIPIYVTNLEQFENTVAVIGNDIFWILPEDRPSMDFHWTVGDESGIIPIDYFTHYGAVVTAEGLSIEVYRSFAKITIDVSEECETPDELGISSISYEYALMTRPETLPEGTTLPLPYPICDFLAIDDIFACEVYDFCHDEEETPLKGNNSGSRTETFPDACIEGNIHIQSGSHSILCHESCNAPQEYPYNSSDRSSTNLSLIKKLSPNPFDSGIQLTINAEAAGKVNFIEVFDATGTSVFLKKDIVQKGHNEIYLDLSHLHSGLYFLRLDCEKESKTIKLLKQ